MTGSLLARPRRPRLLAAGCLAVACSALIWTAAGCAAAGRPASRPSRATAPVPPRPRPSPSPTSPASMVPAIGRDPAQLASQLSAAERVLGSDGVPAAVLARQALIVQLACLRLTAHPGWARLVIERVARPQRAATAADIAATADLVALTPPATRLPRWRIVQAESMAALRADYLAAQAATGVGWSYLASINFVETDFGRVAGPSSAGALGPMQFLPATWAAYGHGDIYRASDAIAAAARYLADHGAVGDIGAALYAYNPSWGYVDAVERYAGRLRADPRALAGYYSRQVIYRLAGRWVLLPVGYGIDPGVRAVVIRL